MPEETNLSDVAIPAGCRWVGSQWEEPDGLQLSEEERQHIQEADARRAMVWAAERLVAADAALKAAKDEWSNARGQFRTAHGRREYFEDIIPPLPLAVGNHLVTEEGNAYVVRKLARL